MNREKLYIVEITYSSNKTIIRYLTLQAFKEMIEYVGYTKEPYADIYFCENDEGFNILKVLDVVILFRCWK